MESTKCLLVGGDGLGQIIGRGKGLLKRGLIYFFGSVEWMLEFDKAVVQHIMTQASNNSMVLLDTTPQQRK